LTLPWNEDELRGRRVLVLAGGEPETGDFVRRQWQENDVIVAANGGSRLAVASGLRPHMVVGDLDSLTAEEIRTLEMGTPIWRHPREKNASDLELALECARRLDPSEIVVVGAMGGRLDHLLVNIGLLHWARIQGVRLRLLGSRGSAHMIAHPASFNLPLGSIVSLVPVTDQVSGVTLEGLLYPLQGGVLAWGSSRGLSNEVVSSPVRVHLDTGILLMICVERP
jgi:thiamine pyrophosphokinase